MPSTTTLLSRLSPQALESVDLLADSFLAQLSPSEIGQDDLAVVLDRVRSSCSCLLLVAELTESVQAELAALLPSLHRSPASFPDSIEASAKGLAELAVWRAFGRITGVAGSVTPSESPSLPIWERFRRGDRVEILEVTEGLGPTEADASASGIFAEYTDPRVGHSARMARVQVVDNDSAVERVISVATDRLRPGPSAEEVASLSPEPGDDKPLLRSFSAGDFELFVYETGDADRHGRARLAFELFDFRWGQEGAGSNSPDRARGDPEPIISSSDFYCSLLHDPASDETLASILSFLTLRPGDTDLSFFSTYSPRQLKWLAARADLLSAELDDFCYEMGLSREGSR